MSKWLTTGANEGMRDLNVLFILPGYQVFLVLDHPSEGGPSFIFFFSGRVVRTPTCLYAVTNNGAAYLGIQIVNLVLVISIKYRCYSYIRANSYVFNVAIQVRLYIPTTFLTPLEHAPFWGTRLGSHELFASLLRTMLLMQGPWLAHVALAYGVHNHYLPHHHDAKTRKPENEYDTWLIIYLSTGVHYVGSTYVWSTGIYYFDRILIR